MANLSNLTAGIKRRRRRLDKARIRVKHGATPEHRLRASEDIDRLQGEILRLEQQILFNQLEKENGTKAIQASSQNPQGHRNMRI